MARMVSSAKHATLLVTGLETPPVKHGLRREV